MDISSNPQFDVEIKNDPSRKEDEVPKVVPNLTDPNQDEVDTAPMIPNPDLGHPDRQAELANPASVIGEQNDVTENPQYPFAFGTPDNERPIGAANQAL